MSSELAVRTFYKGFCAAVKFSAEGYSVTRPAINRWRISKEVRGVVYHKDLFLDKALHLVSADSSWEKPVTKTGEQGGARQPATAVDSKSEGNKQPEPESEGRSQ